MADSKSTGGPRKSFRDHLDFAATPETRKKIKELAVQGCTYAEIAAGLEMSPDTLAKVRLRIPALQKMIDGARAQGTSSLRTLMFRQAHGKDAFGEKVPAAQQFRAQSWLAKHSGMFRDEEKLDDRPATERVRDEADEMTYEEREQKIQEFLKRRAGKHGIDDSAAAAPIAPPLPIQ